MVTEKKKSGRWKSGESGNPKGRPTGVGEVTKLRDSIAAHLPEIITQLVMKAKKGDVQAARLLLERVLPTLKPTEQAARLTLPAGDLTRQGVAILQAVADGSLTSGQGSQLLTGLGALARIKEIDEIDRRIAKLEGVNLANN